MRIKVILILALLSTVVLVWRLAPLPLRLEISSESAPSQTVQVIHFGPRNSLAVVPPRAAGLPEDLSWFPEGFAIHLAQQLMEYSRLHVISPNSSLRFQLDDVAPRIIAERLVVRHLVITEFTVAGEVLELQAELWDAKDQSVVWGGSYAAAPGQWYESLHRLEQDVATAMARKSASRTPLALGDEAWLPYLEGLSKLARFEFFPAVEAFDRSYAANDTYVAALVAGALARLSSGVQGEDAAARLEQAGQQLERALALDKENGRALALLSFLRRDIDWSFDPAMAFANRAVAALPGDSAVLQLSAQAALSTGEFEHAVDWLERAVERDPLNLGLRLARGHAQEYAGDWDAALASYRQTLLFNDAMPAAYAYRARIKLLQDKPDVALEEAEQETDPFWSRYALILARSALEQHDEALEILDALIEEDGKRAACQIAEIQAFRGEVDLAFEWLGRAVEYRDAGIMEIAGNRFFVPLHDDPRWLSLLGQLGLPLLDSDKESD